MCDTRQTEVTPFHFQFGRWFCPNFQSNCPYKSKEAKQYKFYIIKAYFEKASSSDGRQPEVRPLPSFKKEKARTRLFISSLLWVGGGGGKSVMGRGVI